jgi:hypothetical protein
VLQVCSNFVGGWVQEGDNLDRLEQPVQAFRTSRKRRERAKFVGGLWAVPPEIALFWATDAPLCNLCKSCKAA